MSSLHGASEVRPLGAPARNRWLLFIALFAGIVIAVVGSVVLARALRPGSPSQAVVPVVTARPAATPSPTATPVPTPTGDPQAAAVLEAYINETNAYVHALTTTNPSDPDLAATMTGPVRIKATTHIAIAQTLRITFRGDIAMRAPQVLSVSGTTAAATSCQIDTLRGFNAQGQAVNGTTWEALPPSYNPNVPLYFVSHATLALVDGVWRVQGEVLDVVSASECPGA